MGEQGLNEWEKLRMRKVRGGGVAREREEIGQERNDYKLISV